jgi:excinuclease ABC subunit C
MSFDSVSFLSTLTLRAGVYQMYDAEGVLLYVGKAKNLKQRVSSYFRARGLNDKTLALVGRISRIEIIVTASETEALILEQTLIKQHKPQYNILLKDDKSYPYIYLSNHKFPLLAYRRGQRVKSGKYFGPYPNAHAVRESLSYLQRIFKLRNCEDSYFSNRSRPCLQYQIKRCSAPCVDYISREDYQRDIESASLFLQGKSRVLIEELEQQMEETAAELLFERAGEIRDQLLHLRTLQEKQYVSLEKGSIDSWAVFSSKGTLCVQRLSFREGTLINSKSYFPDNKLGLVESVILNDTLAQYYLSGAPAFSFPSQILVEMSEDDGEVMLAAINEVAKTACYWLRQPKSEKRKWLQMAKDNAENAATSKSLEKNAYYQRFVLVGELLGLEKIPNRIECFDISHSKGEATVASCVAADDKGPRKDLYRRFNIKGITPGDDYAAIHQAVFRHFSRLKEQQDFPDVLLIDGAQGQVNQAYKALQELSVTDVFILGISKGESRKAGWEFLWPQGESTPILPGQHNAGFLQLQEVRDEAHRFAITGHRKQRAKARTTSGLETIPGVGAKRRRELLRYFGSMSTLKGASIEEIAKVPGISTRIASDIYAALNQELKD